MEGQEVKLRRTRNEKNLEDYSEDLIQRMEGNTKNYVSPINIKVEHFGRNADEKCLCFKITQDENKLNFERIDETNDTLQFIHFNDYYESIVSSDGGDILNDILVR
ncbi:MAG: hypothetical protein ACI94Y_004489 [Maribacter sp.]